MKIRRLFESKYNTNFFKNSKLEDYFEEERIFNEKKENMLMRIAEYIKLNNDYFDSEYEFDSEKINDFSVEEINLEPNNRLALKISEGNWARYLKNEDFEKLVKFINNPDLYKTQIKYNL